MYDFTEGRKERAFVWGDYVDQLILQLNGSGPTAQKLYFHNNHLYSPAAVTDAAGVVVERYRYSAYGKQTITANDGIAERNRSAVGVRQTFTGRYTDEETGHQYFRARQYDPTQGRFVSRNPFLAAGRVSYELNRLTRGAPGLRVVVVRWAGVEYVDGYGMYYSKFSSIGSTDAMGTPTDVGAYDGADSGENDTASGEDFEHQANEHDVQIDMSSFRDLILSLAYWRSRNPDETIGGLHIYDHGMFGFQYTGYNDGIGNLIPDPSNPKGPPIYDPADERLLSDLGSLLDWDSTIYFHGCGVGRDLNFLRWAQRHSRHRVVAWDGPGHYMRFPWYWYNPEGEKNTGDPLSPDPEDPLSSVSIPVCPPVR